MRTLRLATFSQKPMRQDWQWNANERCKMRRKLLVWALIVLALPIYWTVDKVGQKLAVSIASKRVLQVASDQAFWVRKFNLKTPLERQVVYFDDGARLDSNAIVWEINGDLGGVPFDHEVVFTLRAKNGKLTWLKYHMDMCGDAYCPFDGSKFLPTREYSKEEMQSEWFTKKEKLRALIYDLIVVYEVGISGSGEVRGSSLYILDSARNPVDRFFRDIASDGPPDFWLPAWQPSEDILLKSISER